MDPVTVSKEPVPPSLEVAGLAAIPPLRQEIRFDQVGMDYGAGLPVLRDVSFAIPAGRITAIAGPSGSGKTTLADMVMGLVEPSAGRVLLDGRPLAHYGLRAWRDRVAYVPQDGFLLNDSIAANLAVAAPGADPAQMWAALEASGAAGFVALGKASTLRDVCVGGHCPPSAHDDLVAGRTAATISTIGFIVAGVGVGVGIYGLVRMEGPTRTTGGLRVRPLIGLGVGGIEGEF